MAGTTTIINPSKPRRTRRKRTPAKVINVTPRRRVRRRKNPVDPRAATAAGGAAAFLLLRAIRSMLGQLGQKWGDVLVLALAGFAYSRARTPESRAAAGGALAAGVVFVLPRLLPSAAPMAGALGSSIEQGLTDGLGLAASRLPTINAEQVSSMLGAVYAEDASDFGEDDDEDDDLEGPYAEDASDFGEDDDEDDGEGY